MGNKFTIGRISAGGAFIFCAVVVAFNFYFLGAGLLALATAPEIDSASADPDHLPAIKDTYRLPPPPAFLTELTARSVYVSVENNAPWPLIKKSVDEPLPLASLTKLMTALVVLDLKPDWNKIMTISGGDKRGGAYSPLHIGETISVRDLWALSLVSSDNDATAALVRSTGVNESDFINKMNQKAVALDMASSKFVEPTGLSSENSSTTHNMALLSRAAFTTAEIFNALSQKSATITISGIKQTIKSSDLKLRDISGQKADWKFLSGKTGHIEESGYNASLIAQIADGHKALVVLLGSASAVARADEVAEIAVWVSKFIP